MVPRGMNRGSGHGPGKLWRAVFRLISLAKLRFGFLETLSVVSKFRVSLVTGAIGRVKLFERPASGKCLPGMMFAPMCLMVRKFFALLLSGHEFPHGPPGRLRGRFVWN